MSAVLDEKLISKCKQHVLKWSNSTSVELTRWSYEGVTYEDYCTEYEHWKQLVPSSRVCRSPECICWSQGVEERAEEEGQAQSPEGELRKGVYTERVRKDLEQIAKVTLLALHSGTAE